MPSLPLRHVSPPSSVSHTPAAEMATASRSGSPGHVTIECRHSPPPRAASEPRRVLPEPPVEGEGGAAVLALEEDARVAARIDHAVGLARHDHPDALERMLAALGQFETAACSHTSAVGSSA